MAKRNCPWCGESCAHGFCGRCEAVLPAAPVGEPAPMPPEIQVGDIVTDRLLGVVTVRELDGIGGVIVVTSDGMEAVVPVDDILSIYRDPLWWRAKEISDRNWERDGNQWGR